MSPLTRGPVAWRYGIAILSTGIVTVLTLLLQPYLKHGVMAIFFASVMISAWIGGLGPGLVASTLSVLACCYFFFPPIYSFAAHSDDDIAQIVVFSIVTILISALTDRQKKITGELKSLTNALESRVKERTAWLTLLYDITRSANEVETLGQAFRFAAHRLCQEEIWIACRVYLPVKDEPDVLLRSPYSHSRAGDSGADRLRAGDGAAGRAYRSATVETGPDDHLAFPVVVGGSVRAVFDCISRERLENSENLVRLMSAIGLELGQVADRRRLQEEYADAVWQQQVRIAHELHDGLGQELTGLGFLSKSLAVSMAGTEGAEAAGRVREGIERSLEQIRGLARGVMPVEREPEGLMSALRQLAAAVESVHHVACRFQCPTPVLLPDHQIASQIYRIAQEALTNAVKHAKASNLTVSLEASDKDITLRVTDDGVGLPDRSEKLPTGSGLRIMKYRAAALGATLTVQNAASKGTEVICRLPKTTPAP